MRAHAGDANRVRGKRRTQGWGDAPLPPWDTLFAYDRWANERWIAFAERRKWKSGDAVMEHIVRASEVWLSRVHKEEPPEVANASLNMRLAANHLRWLETFRDYSPEKVIRYTNLAGERYQSYLGDIAAHVINHGTYHRGQLRERAGSEGFEDFPETDLILFLRESSRTV